MASKTPKYDVKIEKILGELKPGERTCLASGRIWMMDEGEISWYKKFNMPPSEYHPETKTKLFGSTWAAFSWWWNKDALTGEKVLTHVHPYSPFKVISDDEWYKQDFISYGRDYDPNRSFFDQLHDLACEVPFSAWKNFEKPINSIARVSFGDEDSYFVVASRSRRTAYTENVLDIEDSLEAVISNNIYRSHSVLHSQRISDSYCVRESYDCMKSWFVFDCRDCENCFGAWNKRHKKYLWFNEQLSKEEWEKRFEQVDTTSYKEMNAYRKKFYEAIASEAIWPSAFMVKCENSTGEYITNCVDCVRAWGSDGSKNEFHCKWGQMGSEDNFQGVCPGSNNCFMSSAAISSSRAHFSYFVTRCQDVEYCIECYDCESCFGCTNLRRKKFCIFNKQYSEEEYWKKVDEIKCAMLDRREYGRYMDGRFNYVPRDSSNGRTLYEDFADVELAHLNIPEYKHDLNGAFGDWSGKDFHSISELPDSVNDIDVTTFSKTAFRCEEIDRPYTYALLELRLNKQLKTPMSRKHFIQRITDLWMELNVDAFHGGICAKCNDEVEYAKNRVFPNRKVYCLKCYHDHLESYG